MRLPGLSARDAELSARGCFVTVEMSPPAHVADILALVGAPVTIFAKAEEAVGDTARLLVGLARDGHEIALLDEGLKVGNALPQEQAVAALSDARAALERAAGTTVAGYRAVGRSLPPETLAAAGFRYESSLAGGLRAAAVTGATGAAAVPAVIASFPVFHLGDGEGTMARVIGDTLLQSVPLPALIAMLRQAARSGAYPVVCLRPGVLVPRLDPVDLTHEAGAGRLSRWNLGLRTHPRRLEAASPGWKLREILRQFPPQGRLRDALPAPEGS